MANRFTPTPRSTDPRQMMAMMNKNFAELDAESATKVYYNPQGKVGEINGLLPNGLGVGTLLKDTAGRNSIAMYIDNAGQPILKVAKTGKDAVTDGASDMIFNSAQNVFKIVGSGTLTIPAMTLGAAVQTNTYTTTTTSATNTHNLGYIPAVIAYVLNSSGQYETFPYTGNSAGGPGGGIYTVYSGISVTSTQIYAYSGIVAYGAYVFTGAGEIARPLKYFLLQETAN